MRDQVEAQLWADHGPQFAGDVAKALNWLLDAFCAVTAIRNRAPWRESGSEIC